MPSQHLRQMNGRINSFFFSIRTKQFSFQVTLHLMTVSVRSQKTNLIEKLFFNTNSHEIQTYCFNDTKSVKKKFFVGFTVSAGKVYFISYINTQAYLSTGLFISPSRISDPCGTVAGMVTPKGSMSTEGETLQVSVLPYRCSICAPLVTRQMSIL